MLSMEYYLIEDAELKNIQELAPDHSSEDVLDALEAEFEDGSDSDRNAFVRCKSLGYPTLDRIVSYDGAVDRLRHLMNEQSRRNLWLLQWGEPDETTYYLIWRNVLLNVEDALSGMSPSDLHRLTCEFEEFFEPAPGWEVTSAVGMRAFDRTPIGEDINMDDSLREFLLSEFQRTGYSTLICLQWTE